MNARHARWFGYASLLVALTTWVMDLAGIVGPCGYCRVQRTAIGLLGLCLLFPPPRAWLLRWIAGVVAAYGIVTAATQHFKGWNSLSKSEFQFVLPLYTNDFLLSGAALAILVLQIMVIQSDQRR